MKGWQAQFEQFCENLIVTMGDKGSRWISKHSYEPMVTIPVDPIEVSSVSGAGDTALAGIVMETLRSYSIAEAMSYGNRAARIAVSKRGVVAVRAEEVV